MRHVERRTAEVRRVAWLLSYLGGGGRWVRMGKGVETLAA
jgi:hypothetical protein